jgi:hypothetical protein
MVKEEDFFDKCLAFFVFKFGFIQGDTFISKRYKGGNIIILGIYRIINKGKSFIYRGGKENFLALHLIILLGLLKRINFKIVIRIGEGYKILIFVY